MRYLPSVYVKFLSSVSKAQQVDFEPHIKRFSFVHRIHKNNFPQFQRLMAESPSLIADIAATVVGHLESEGALKFDIFRWALQGCNEEILDLGFEISTIEHIRTTLDQMGCHAMLVTGCQDPDILKARVQCAYDTMRQLGFPFKVVLSGRNPTPNQQGAKVRTVNEARQMEAFLHSFKSLHTREKPPWDTLTVIEQRAHNTLTNLEEFIKLNLFEVSRKNYLYVVSSTFHLPRIASTIDQLMSRNQLPIESIVLVGAENAFAANRVPSSSRYLKSMLHEVFTLIFKKSSQ